MALITLVPAPHFLTRINSKLHNFAVFGVTLGTGMLLALAGAVFPAEIYMQPDFLPQTPLSITINIVMGITLAAVLYYILSVKMKNGQD